MDEFIQHLGIVLDCEQRLLAAIDAPGGWTESAVFQGASGHIPSTRTVMHANGAGLRFCTVRYPTPVSSCEALLAQAVVENRDGRGVVVVRQGWVPFGTTGWSDMIAGDLDRITSALHRHLGTASTARKHWGQHAFHLAVHRNVQGAMGQWLAKCPGIVAGETDHGVVAFILADQMEKHAPDKLLGLVQTSFQGRLPATVSTCLAMPPDMMAAITALGLRTRSLVGFDRRHGLISGFVPRTGMSFGSDTLHDRLAKIAAAEAYLDQHPQCPEGPA